MSLSHRIEHDAWMIHPGDVDYLEPAERWCRVCGELDSAHRCPICNRMADDPWLLVVDGEIQECCGDGTHRSFWTAEQREFLAPFFAWQQKRLREGKSTQYIAHRTKAHAA